MVVLSNNLSKIHTEALHYFAARLISPQMRRHLAIKIVFRKNMDHLGLTHIDDYNDLGRPRTFTIEIDRNQTEEEILRTMAHEMVHVRQYCKGELNEEMTYWRGQYFNKEMNYDDQPWELEADILGDELFEEFDELCEY